MLTTPALVYPQRNPRPWLWVAGIVGGVAVTTGVVAGVVAVRNMRRRAAGPVLASHETSKNIIACETHRGHEVCIWKVTSSDGDAYYKYSITDGTASKLEYSDPVSAAVAGRIFVEVLTAGRPAQE